MPVSIDVHPEMNTLMYTAYSQISRKYYELYKYTQSFVEAIA